VAPASVSVCPQSRLAIPERRWAGYDSHRQVKAFVRVVIEGRSVVQCGQQLVERLDMAISDLIQCFPHDNDMMVS